MAVGRSCSRAPGSGLVGRLEAGGRAVGRLDVWQWGGFKSALLSPSVNQLEIPRSDDDDSPPAIAGGVGGGARR